MAEKSDSSGDGGYFSNILSEIVRSPIDIALVGIITFLIYKIIMSRLDRGDKPVYVEQELPKLRKDFTVEELRKYDGNAPDGRVLVAVNGNIYDVTKGKMFYGPGGPYSAFGGRDASRGLATFSLELTKDEYDDLSDLNTMEMESVREWEMQFKDKYIYVGRLLRPGQQPTNYSDEEEEEVSVTGPADDKDKPNDE